MFLTIPLNFSDDVKWFWDYLRHVLSLTIKHFLQLYLSIGCVWCNYGERLIIYIKYYRHIIIDINTMKTNDDYQVSQVLPILFDFIPGDIVNINVMYYINSVKNGKTQW